MIKNTPLIQKRIGQSLEMNVLNLLPNKNRHSSIANFIFAEIETSERSIGHVVERVNLYRATEVWMHRRQQFQLPLRVSSLFFSASSPRGRINSITPGLSNRPC